MVQDAAALGNQVVVTLAEGAEKHLMDTDIVAAFPTVMPDFSKMPNLKWVHSFSAGVDRVLTEYIKDSNILISNSSGIHKTPIAEHIIGFMLMFTRRFYHTFQNQQKHIWEKDYTLGELYNKNVLIVGAGEIGMEAARLAHAFGAHVMAVTRSQKPKPDFVDAMGLDADLNTMLHLADFVVISLPHTPETHHFFDARRFALMKPDAVIINIGRGSIINEQDLIEALRQNVIGGAALDVTEKEPLPPDSPLWNMENVIITPHHSGLSDQYMNRAIDLFCKNLSAFLKGQSLLTEVNKDLGY